MAEILTPIERVIQWNKARFDRKFNTDITYKLLNEEVLEFFIAAHDKDRVEMIDALGDILFVAIGALWKFGFCADEIDQVLLAICDSNDTKPSNKIASNKKYCADGKGKAYKSPTEVLQQLIKNREYHE